MRPGRAKIENHWTNVGILDREWTVLPRGGPSGLPKAVVRDFSDRCSRLPISILWRPYEMRGPLRTVRHDPSLKATIL